MYWLLFLASPGQVSLLRPEGNEMVVPYSHSLCANAVFDKAECKCNVMNGRKFTFYCRLHGVALHITLPNIDKHVCSTLL